MSRFVFSVLIGSLLASLALANSTPVVSDVTASQRKDGSKLVDICYDLADPDGDTCTVSLKVSSDGGATWTVPVMTFLPNSAVGSGINPGYSKRMVWDAAKDLPGVFGRNYRVKVIADDNTTPADMVFIPSGTFQMGNSTNAEEGVYNELPVHTVTLDSFAMGKYEITNEQYCAFLNSAYPSQLKVVKYYVYASGDTENSYRYCEIYTSSDYGQIVFLNNTFSVLTKGGRYLTNDPVVWVSQYGARAYCNWRSQQEGKEPCYDLSTWNCDFSKKGYRLPTEAEWEYAARGGLSGQRFPWGDTITHSQANYQSAPYSYDISPTRGFHPTWKVEDKPYTSPVGSFPANDYGLYDMTGNAAEWCNDWYSYESYSSSPQTNPTGPSTNLWGSIIRGGSWDSFALYCRVSNRTNGPNWGGDSEVGFRVVLNLNSSEGSSGPGLSSVLTLDTRNDRLHFYVERNGTTGYQPGDDEDVSGEPVYYNNRDMALSAITDSQGQVYIYGLDEGDQVFVRHVAFQKGSPKGSRGTAGTMVDLYMDTDHITETGDVDPYEFSSSDISKLVQDPLDIPLSHPVFSWNVVVALNWKANSGYLSRLRTGFENASEYLFDVTDGQMKIGRVDIRNNAAVSSSDWFEADMQIKSGDQFPQSNLWGVRYSTCYVFFPQYFNGSDSKSGNPDTASYFRSIIHELGHYMLGFYDEYLNGEGKKYPWRQYRAAHPGEVPMIYGIMDYQFASDELSSNNDYRAASFYTGKPAREVTNQIWDHDLANATTPRHLPCWQFLFENFDCAGGLVSTWGNLDGIQVKLSMPPDGVFTGRNASGAEQRSSEDRGGPYFIPAPYVKCEFPVASPPPSKEMELESSDVEVSVLDQGVGVRQARVWLENSEGRRIEQSRTDRQGKTTCYGVSLGDKIVASWGGKVISAPWNSEDRVILSSREARFIPPPAGEIPRLLIASTPVLDQGKIMLRIRILADQDLVKVPSVSIHPSFEGSVPVPMAQTNPMTYEGVMEIGMVVEGSMDVSAEGSGGQVATTAEFNIQQMGPNPSNRIFGPGGWLEVISPKDTFDQDTRFVLNGTGDIPIPYADNARVVLTEPVSLRVQQGVIVGSPYVINWQIQTDSLLGRDATQVRLCRFDENSRSWQEVPCDYAPGSSGVSASGITDGIYALFGTDSTDRTPPGDIQDLSADKANSGWSIALEWTAPGDDGYEGRALRYTLLYSTEPITPQNRDRCLRLPLFNAPQIAGQREQYVFEMPDPDKLYYFVVQAEDEAGNRGGVSNGAQAVSNVMDTDGDGLPDQWERAYGFNPTEPGDQMLDPDKDGVINAYEYRLGMLPNCKDSDGDGIPDGIEFVDLDKNGKIDLGDLGIFAEHWMEGQCYRCPGADFTGNGTVGIEDLLELSSRWLMN